MVNALVSDLIQCSAERLRAAAPADIDAVRAQPAVLMGMSDAVRAQHVELKQFLNENVYRHQRVLRMTLKAKRVVQQLFEAFTREIRLMPAEYCESAQRAETRDRFSGRARIVADYIAGMTDRYAILEHRRLFDPAERT
jgi:dGTPase